MSNDSGGGNGGLWIALIGLFTTVSGGVFANWDRIFPPAPEPEAVIAAGPTAAGAADEAASEPAEPAASVPQ